MDGSILAPVGDVVQLGERAYQAVLNGIVSGSLAPGKQLALENLARQLEVSATPVREALSRLEKDGLVIKVPYQGWFVTDFTEEELRDIYELRTELECFSVRLACKRITEEEITWLQKHQDNSEAVLAAGDLATYRTCNRDLHQAIVKAAKNKQLAGVYAQLWLRFEVLTARTMQVSGRPSRAVKEHRRLIELIAARKPDEAAALMERHLVAALEDISQPKEKPAAEPTSTG